MILFLSGLFIGGFCGVVTMGLMITASDADDKLLGDDQYK